MNLPYTNPPLPNNTTNVAFPLALPSPALCTCPKYAPNSSSSPTSTSTSLSPPSLRYITSPSSFNTAHPGCSRAANWRISATETWCRIESQTVLDGRGVLEGVACGEEKAGVDLQVRCGGEGGHAIVGGLACCLQICPVLFACFVFVGEVVCFELRSEFASDVACLLGVQAENVLYVG
ncbi:hypothetical protein HBI30_202720 [Parastagonospora nodorum]|nr:hypothetical protein HBI30_202720 [Parastagonospora nodorum]